MTGDVYAGFYAKGILGAVVLRDYIFEATRAEARGIAGKIIGECVVDPSGTGLSLNDDGAAINERTLTVGGDLYCLNDDGYVVAHAGNDADLVQLVEGSRTITLRDPSWFADLPFENTNADTYRVYIAVTAMPIDVGVSKVGSRGYSRFIDVPGVTVKASSVTDVGTGLKFRITTGLTDLGIQPWTTSHPENSSWSYDAVVWIDNESDLEIAVNDPDVAIGFAAKLTKRTGSADWVVNLTGIGDGYLGQSDPDLNADNYNITVLGPIITQTNFDSNPSYIFVGTTASTTGNDTQSTVGQRIIESVSQNLVDSSDVPESLFIQGWTTKPSVTFNAASVDFGAGEAFVDGQVVTTNVDSLSSLSISTTLWMYYDHGDDDYHFSTSFSTATASSRVLIARVETDGSGNITLGIECGRSYSKFTDASVLTVSSNSNHHAMFSTLKGALAWASGRNTVDVNDPGWTIELIGTITAAEAISDADLFVPNVKFRGRGGSKNASTAAVNGSRITWTFDGPLFQIPSGATMKDWSFESVAFEMQGTGTVATTSLITNHGDIDGLVFRDCLVHGNDVLGSNLYLAHVIYSDANEVKRVTFDRCTLYSAEAPFYVAAGGEASTFITIRDCVIQNDSTATTLGQAGFITDIGAAAGEPANWHIRGNRATNLQGPGIKFRKLKDSRITDNEVSVVGAFSALSLGESGIHEDVEKLFIKDNVFVCSSLGATPVVQIWTGDESSTVRVRILVHDNVIDGTDSPGSSIGFKLFNGAGVAVGQSLIHDNIICNVETAVSVENFDDSIVHSNVIEAEFTGILYDGIAGGIALVSGNVVSMNGAAAKGIDVDTTGSATESISVFGNAININDASSTPIGIDADGAQDTNNSMIAGNLIKGAGTGIKFDGNTSIVGLNLLVTCDLSIGTVDSGLMLSMNQLTSGDIVATGTVTLSSFAGCMVNGDVTVPVATKTNFTGCQISSDLIIGGDEAKVVGCNIGNDIDLAIPVNDGDKTVIVGNTIGGDVNDGTGTSTWIVSSNYFFGAGSHTYDVESGLWTGNYYAGDVTLSGSVNLGAVFVGNKIAGAFTDNSTGSTVANNES